jgi:hypothetical protein
MDGHPIHKCNDVMLYTGMPAPFVIYVTRLADHEYNKFPLDVLLIANANHIHYIAVTWSFG